MESTTIVKEEAPSVTETADSQKKLNLNNPKKESTRGSRILFAANLSLQIQETDIVDFFSEACEVVDVRLATDRDDGRLKGYGHVEFASHEEANNALGFNNRLLLGRAIRLDFANLKP